MMKIGLLLSLAASSSAFLISPSPALSGSRTLAPAAHSLSALCRIRPAIRSGRGAALLVRAQGAATEGAATETSVDATEKGTVGILGVTGGVGRLTAAAVMAQGFKVRAIVRDAGRARPLLPSGIEIVEADVRFPEQGVGLARAIQGVESLLVLTGTSAFPTKKWGPNNENNPKAVDEVGTKNLVVALDAVNKQAKEEGGRSVKRVTLLSSIGVQRRTQFPFSILNTFGVLDAKAAGELALIQGAARSGYKYAIVRPGRLIGGPYTNPDFANLLKLDEKEAKSVELRNGDPSGFKGDASRRQTALALAQTLIQGDVDMDFSLVNKEGNVLTQDDWDSKFEALSRPPEALRLEFNSLNQEKFARWLSNWGAGIVTSGGLFPPLPIPFRVDYPDDGAIGLNLNFLSVTVQGEVTPIGSLQARLVDDKRGKVAFVVTRFSATADMPFPGEVQILDKLQEDLYRVTTNAAAGAQSMWGTNNIDL
eukprot:CAMPEP_0180137870 /NCGR_PEP_ID=MMETSP0986-20121125/12506_1 /TAXON_ID=697907 /ORGANISM="non described non described, Strain CCMP2293" /LENGTH=479 /DNA_ID=CAMNT_0022079487 /DNA_START=38 /DNA_END=1477 /DNA_ORIENTATION=+